jgi:O-acetyl-ADP-ribose deacetylase (regulator of RNase III)
MIKTITGDMLAGVKAGYILHGCNALGMMGSGIAKAIRDKWPLAYDVYRKEFEDSGLMLGDVIPVEVEPGLIVMNCITQQLCGSDGQKYVSYDAVAECMDRVSFCVKGLHIQKTVNFPLIGAGLGGGKWEVIEPILDHYLTVDEKYLWKLP